MQTTATLTLITHLENPDLGRLLGQGNQLLENSNQLRDGFKHEIIDGYPDYYVEIGHEYTTWLNNVAEYVQAHYGTTIDYQQPKYLKKFNAAAFRPTDSPNFDLKYYGQEQYLYSNLLHNINQIGNSLLKQEWHNI